MIATFASRIMSFQEFSDEIAYFLVDHTPFTLSYTHTKVFEWKDFQSEKKIYGCGVISYSTKYNYCFLYLEGVWSKNVNPVISAIMLAI